MKYSFPMLLSFHLKMIQKKISSISYISLQESNKTTNIFDRIKRLIYPLQKNLHIESTFSDKGSAEEIYDKM